MIVDINDKDTLSDNANSGKGTLLDNAMDQLSISGKGTLPANATSGKGTLPANATSGKGTLDNKCAQTELSNYEKVQDLLYKVDMLSYDLDSIIKNQFCDKKMYIFDFDFTLHFHRKFMGHFDCPCSYIEEILETLKKKGKILCIASHNRDINFYVDILDLEHLFDYICQVTDFNGELIKKDIMITDILKKYKYDPEDVIFFDDQKRQIDIVEQSLNIDCYHVPNYGILECFNIDSVN